MSDGTNFMPVGAFVTNAPWLMQSYREFQLLERNIEILKYLYTQPFALLKLS